MFLALLTSPADPETTSYSTNTLTALRAGGTLSFNSGTLAQGQLSRA